MHIEALKALEAIQNDGRGVTTVRGIIIDLERGKLADAKAGIAHDWDKIANYPDIARWFKENGLAEKSWYVNSYLQIEMVSK